MPIVPAISGGGFVLAWAVMADKRIGDSEGTLRDVSIRDTLGSIYFIETTNSSTIAS